MKAIIDDFATTIELTDKEIKEFCKIGMGSDTCIWLVVSGSGFECLYHAKPINLLDRWRKGLTVAKRDGCDKVKEFDQFDQAGEIEF